MCFTCNQCNKCGKLDSGLYDNKLAALVCPDCGTAIGPDERKCPACGRRVPPAVPPPAGAHIL